MPVGLVIPISGPYVGDWIISNTTYLMGWNNDDGFELQVTVQGQEINESDAYGMTLVEAIYRGQNWRVRLRSLEWNFSGNMGVLLAFGTSTTLGASTSVLTPTLGPVGDRWTRYDGTLLLTAILGNPPTQPQTLTAKEANIAPNSQSSWMMTSKMREMPLEMVLFPYVAIESNGTFTVPFTVT